MENISLKDIEDAPVTNELLESSSRVNYYGLACLQAQTVGLKNHFEILLNSAKKDQQAAIEKTYILFVKPRLASKSRAIQKSDFKAKL